MYKVELEGKLTLGMVFKTAVDFRKSLEARLQKIAQQSGEDLQRLRRKVAFDRFLARIFTHSKPGFFLKGGYAMELRIDRARATKDIDLTCLHRINNDKDLFSELVLLELQELVKIDLHDHFFYQVGQSQIDLENAPYGGARYPVLALIGGRPFVRFHLDIGADIVLDSVEKIQGIDWLGFCGISPMISVEQQFAEKLHCFTLPRNGTNSRVKDLVDMVLLLKIKVPKPEDFFCALRNVFKARQTHVIPDKLNEPPVEWGKPYAALAFECGLEPDIKKGFNAVKHFYEQIGKNRLLPENIKNVGQHGLEPGRGVNEFAAPAPFPSS